MIQPVDFTSIGLQAEICLAADETPRARLHALCRLLKESVPHYDWVGFYRTETGGTDLLLGPFAGAPTDHTRIAVGRGICGQAAAQCRTIIVPDVRAQSNYLACSVRVRSELVVPLCRDGKVLAELDIDSHTLDAFTETDQHFAEGLLLRCAGALEAMK